MKHAVLSTHHLRASLKPLRGVWGAAPPLRPFGTNTHQGASPSHLRCVALPISSKMRLSFVRQGLSSLHCVPLREPLTPMAIRSSSWLRGQREQTGDGRGEHSRDVGVWVSFFKVACIKAPVGAAGTRGRCPLTPRRPPGAPGDGWVSRSFCTHIFEFIFR